MDDGMEMLARADRLHAENCPACREAAVELGGAGALMAEVAAQSAQVAKADPQRSVRLRPEFKQRVRNEVLIRLGASRRLVRDRAGEWRDDSFVQPAGPVARVIAIATKPPWIASAAALALVALTALGMWQFGAGAGAIGNVDFAMGGFAIEGATSVMGREKRGGVALEGQARIRTDAESGGIISLGRRGAVRMVVAEQTELSVVSQTRVELDAGSVWLRVKPGDQGFTVVTPTCEVRVTGTVFGVSYAFGVTRIEVSEGNVKVGIDGASTSVGAGNVLSAGSDGLGALSAREDGEEMPRWARSLLVAEDAARRAAYLPTVSVKWQTETRD